MTKTIGGIAIVVAWKPSRVSKNGMGVPSGIPDVNLVTEHFTITGGTGRFAGATGSFVMERTVNTVTLESSGEFNGTIALP